MTTATMATTNRTTETAGCESELRAAARRRGLTMKELAAMMGVSAGYLSQVANGRRPWTPKMREKVAALLGEVPGQGDRLPPGRRRDRGEQLHPGARPHAGQDHAGSRRPGWGVLRLHDGRISGSPEHGREGAGAGRVGAEGPGEGRPARCTNRQGCVVSGESSYIRERARELGLSLRDLADRVGVSYSYMSQVARGHSNMGVKVQARVESALKAPAKVAPPGAPTARDAW